MKKLISRKVLKTELSMAAKSIDDHNFGYARQLIQNALIRIDEYDLIVPLCIKEKNSHCCSHCDQYTHCGHSK